MIRLSHLKHSQVMRNISPFVRIPRLGRQVQAKEAIRVAPLQKGLKFIGTECFDGFALRLVP
jgi:hypothetical protein